MITTPGDRPPGPADENEESNYGYYHLYKKYLSDELAYLAVVLNDAGMESVRHDQYAPEPYEVFCLRLHSMSPAERDAYEQRLRDGFEVSRNGDAEKGVATAGRPTTDPDQEEQIGALHAWLRAKQDAPPGQSGQDR